jgi:hypothetical protein
MKSSLAWHRKGPDWVLFSGHRRMGRVVPDSKYPGMWRSTMSGGRLSDMANLAWAKNAVLVAAEREVEYEARCKRTPKCPEKGDVFQPRLDSVRFGVRWWSRESLIKVLYRFHQNDPYGTPADSPGR